MRASENADIRGSVFDKYIYFLPFDSAPHLVPANMKVVATGQTTIRVTWNRIDTKSITGFRGYEIKYVRLSDDSNERLPVGDVANFTLRNLKIFTEYKIQVAALSTQPGNYTPSKTVKTHEGGNVLSCHAT